MLLLLISLSACAGDAPGASTSGSGRLVAVGDLHGDLDASLAVLQLAGLVDESGAWSGDNATLVQTGDTTDRGPDSKGVLELMKRLQKEAPGDGGRVVPLLGNHEVMNLTGDWRYVSEDDLAGFGGAEARKAAFGADAELGGWMRGLDIVAVVERVAFAHGGVTPEYAKLGVDAINGLLATPEVLGNSSPIWFRGYLQGPEPTACKTLELALVELAAERMVVGHTTQDSGEIASRCNGKLLGIDTGISAHYGRNLAAVEIVEGDAKALYPSGTVDLPDPRR
ncbi:MAG TPA: metallophosphoesterase [Myxococcota bacterium]|nr:metallophosphoesterase [Myxococcota bacterium]